MSTQISVLNSKFATSILSEAIDKLSLIQCSIIKSESFDEPFSKYLPNPLDVNKFAKDVDNIKSSVREAMSQLHIDRNFTDISEKSLAEKESKFLDDFKCNEIIFKEKRSILKMLNELLSNHRNATETIDEIIMKYAMQFRLNKNWEKARCNQQGHFYRMMIGDLQEEIDQYLAKISFEKLCILKIEHFSLNEIDFHKLESDRWMEKFDEDSNKMGIDIQMAVAELNDVKMNYEMTGESIKRRDQEIKDFIALQKERIEQKDSVQTKIIYEYKNHLLEQYLYQPNVLDHDSLT